MAECGLKLHSVAPDEVEAFVSGLGFAGVGAATPSKYDKVDKKIKMDPELLRISRAAEMILLRHRLDWERVESTMVMLPSSSRVMVESANNPNGFSRAYRYLSSAEFKQAWAAGNYGQIMNDLWKEMIVAFTIDVFEIKESFKAGLEKVIEAITKKKHVQTAKQAVPIILMFMLMYFSLPKGRSSWSEVPKHAFIATLKTMTIYFASVWVGIPLLEVFDDFCVQHQDLLNAGYEGRAWVPALKGALLNNYVVSMPFLLYEKWTKGHGDDGLPNDLQNDYYCDESFVDVIGEMNIMEDPVLVHGFQMERRTAGILIDKGFNHPITRNRILRAHIIDPPSGYTDLYLAYIRRRFEVIMSIDDSSEK